MAMALTRLEQHLSVTCHELDGCQRRLKLAENREHALEAQVAAGAAQISTLCGALKEQEDAAAHATRLQACEQRTILSARILELEAQLAACQSAFQARMEATMRHFEAEVEPLRERTAVSEGRAQQAAHEAHEARTQASAAEARAQSQGQLVESLRAELACAIEEGHTANAVAREVERTASTAARAADSEKRLLEHRLAETEAKLAGVRPGIMRPLSPYRCRRAVCDGPLSALTATACALSRWQLLHPSATST